MDLEKYCVEYIIWKKLLENYLFEGSTLHC